MLTKLRHRRALLKAAMLPLGMGGLLGLVSGIGWAASELAPPPIPGLPLERFPVLAGHGELRFSGLCIYDARLWVAPTFDEKSYANHPFVLELTYHRAFAGKAIAQRSIEEIMRQRSMECTLMQQWLDQLVQCLPDVRASDRLTGLYQPGVGMRLWHNLVEFGGVNDPELACYFFGIWLSQQTSETRLRAALLRNLGQRVP